MFFEIYKAYTSFDIVMPHILVATGKIDRQHDGAQDLQQTLCPKIYYN